MDISGMGGFLYIMMALMLFILGPLFLFVNFITIIMRPVMAPPCRLTRCLQVAWIILAILCFPGAFAGGTMGLMMVFPFMRGNTALILVPLAIGLIAIVYSLLYKLGNIGLEPIEEDGGHVEM